MNVKLGWRTVLNTNSKYKAEKLAKKIFNALGIDHILFSCEPYWKDKKLYEMFFEQEIKNTHSDKIVMEILNKLSLLSYH